VSDLEREVRQLRKELAKARMERDILKKATAYFANALLPGTPSSKGSNSTSW
jgi:transposase